MTRFRALSTLLLVPLLFAVFVACGGGNDSGDKGSSGSLTPRPRVTRTPISTRTPRPSGSSTAEPTGTRTGTEEPTTTSTGEPSETETPTATPRPSRTPGDPGEQYNGSPITGGDIETAFFDAGFDVTSPDSGEAYDGMSRDGFTLTAEKDGKTFTLILFIYPSPDAMATDWKTEVGSPPEPQDGVHPPGYLNAWWNNNTVVLVTTNPDEALRQELLDAYLTLP